MFFTDIFVRRPVLATVVSLMLLVVGIKSGQSLSVRQYPKTENAVITVATTYYGADPDTLAGFITTPLETAIGQASGIDYMTSTSANGVSTITINLLLNYDADKALTEIATKVNSVLNQLPTGTQQPVLNIRVGDALDSMYIGFDSDVMPLNAVTDYLVRVVQPKLQSVPGVQLAELNGPRNYAMRAWLDPEKLAALGLTAVDVTQAMAANDYISGLGNTKGQMVQVNLNASTNLHTLSEFQNLVLKQANGAVVRLKDVAKVTLGDDDYESQNFLNGRKAVFIGIQVAPSANLLDVLKGCRAAFDALKPNFPEGLDGFIGYDASDFVTSAISEVESTLIEAGIIVTVVVFAFLGSLRSVLIPAVTIPLSLVGTLIMMLIFGFSINLLTLLALVLAIGLVVDDAIIVVENVNRHIDEGMKPLPAAILAARELGGPIIAMTVVLAAVYVPIGFQGGLTGALFTEFAFTLVGAVTVSAIIALTLSPMMCSRLLRPRTHDEARLAGSADWTISIDRNFERVRRHATSACCAQAFRTLAGHGGVRGHRHRQPASSCSPCAQDQACARRGPGRDRQLGDAARPMRRSTQKLNSMPSRSTTYALDLSRRRADPVPDHPADRAVHQRHGDEAVGQAETHDPADCSLWSRQDDNKIAGDAGRGVPAAAAAGLQRRPAGGFRHRHGPAVRQAERGRPEFHAAGPGLRHVHLHGQRSQGRPAAIDRLKIDRDKVADLGLKMSDVGAVASADLAGWRLPVNYFSLDGRSYKVIPQTQQRFRLNTDQLLNYYIPTASGTPVPLSTVATITTKTIPESLNHFQQLNEATHHGRCRCRAWRWAMPSNISRAWPRSTLPQGYLVDYGGQSRQYIQESERFPGDLRLRPHRHFPVTGGVVRELPRPADHPGLGADVIGRRADLHRARRRRRHAQHLYRSRARDA